MIVYRLSWTKYADDLAGEGARLNGGRWNHKLVPCLYTSGSRALAILEYTVNVNIDDIPRALSMATFEIPEKNILTLDIAALPGDWKDSPSPASTKDMGTRILQAGKYHIIKIPSTVIPEESNYIINPLFANHYSLVKTIEIKDLVYDLRIKIS
jgi:RES domain-containing protein